jgi:hemoglobin
MSDRTLYERLGGVYGISTVVDDLLNRVMADSRLNKNPLLDEARRKVSPAGFKYLMTEMVCAAAGGPQKYSGRSMADAQQYLKITAAEWDAFVDDVARTLKKFGIPARERLELQAIVAGTRGDIVVDSVTAAAR